MSNINYMILIGVFISIIGICMLSLNESGQEELIKLRIKEAKLSIELHKLKADQLKDLLK